ncbi:hypothetical protein G6F64_015522 [Rhizopus arrhizus]|uniref:Uncharacterized protein n=1 Tax=Rhizopus oryzae TaxID=64495 RepID=A0A9P6WR65_RHIOR|nr:hypothetical protein G6F64_015522 [Rhizopus arrhizus]
MQEAQRVASRLAFIGLGGARQRAFGIHGHHRSHLGIAGVDARQVRGRHVTGAEMAGGDLGSQCHGGHVAYRGSLCHCSLDLLLCDTKY